MFTFTHTPSDSTRHSPRLTVSIAWFSPVNSTSGFPRSWNNVRAAEWWLLYKRCSSWRHQRAKQREKSTTPNMTEEFLLQSVNITQGGNGRFLLAKPFSKIDDDWMNETDVIWLSSGRGRQLWSVLWNWRRISALSSSAEEQKLNLHVSRSEHFRS